MPDYTASTFFLTQRPYPHGAIASDCKNLNIRNVSVKIIWQKQTFRTDIQYFYSTDLPSVLNGTEMISFGSRLDITRNFPVGRSQEPEPPQFGQSRSQLRDLGLPELPKKVAAPQHCSQCKKTLKLKNIRDSKNKQDISWTNFFYLPKLSRFLTGFSYGKNNQAQ